MAVKTFTQGEVATAADTNTYLANGGLVYINSTTVGTGVTSVTLPSNTFSATYDDYRITWAGGNLSALALIGIYMGNATAASGYYGTKIICNITTAAIVGNSDNNVGQWQNFGVGSTTYADIIFDVLSPYLARRTQIAAPYFELNPTGTSYSGNYTGMLDNTTSYTTLTIDPQGANTMTGGVITVYGYRKA